MGSIPQRAEYQHLPRSNTDRIVPVRVSACPGSGVFDYHVDATVQLGSAVYIWLTTDTLKLPSDTMNVDTVAYNDAEPGTKPDLAFFK